MLSPTVIETAAELAAIEPDWWELWRRVPGATPFTAPAWLLPWWRTFSPGQLRTYAIRDGSRLLALAPMFVEDGPHGRRLLPLGIGLSDIYDVLLDPDRGDAESALASTFWTDRPDWDVASLEALPDGASALSLAAPAGWRDDTCAQEARPILPLPAREDPLRSVPARKRRKLRMAQHRVERRGGVVETVRAGEEGAFLAELFRLHGARWATRGEAGVLAGGQVRAFHAAALPALAEAGLAVALRLRIDGETAGAYYGLRSGDAAYAYLGGFDPRFSFESPGTVLIGAAIADAAVRGATTFDFLRGQEGYKYDWGATDTINRRRTLVRPSA